MEWYPVTEELNRSILLNGTNNNWSIRLSSLYGEAWYSSLMPKPGDYIKVRTIVNPNYFSRQTFSFSFNGCFDVVWISGRFNVPYHWGADISFSGCDGVADSIFSAGPRDYPREDEINKNIGKAFVADSIGSTNENETVFVFRVLGSHSGVNINEYLIEDCSNFIEQQTSIATFDGALIGEAFRKTSQDYFTYYTPVIKVGGQYYVWKNLTDGYVLYTCSTVTTEQHDANTILLPSDVIASIPEITGHDPTLEKLLNAIVNSETNDADLALSSLVDNLTSIVSNVSQLKGTPIATTIDAAIGAFIPQLSTLGINFTNVISMLQNELSILVDTILTNEGNTQQAVLGYINQLFNDIATHNQQINQSAIDASKAELKAFVGEKINEVVTGGGTQSTIPDFITNIIKAVFTDISLFIESASKDVNNKVSTIWNITKNDIEKLWKALDSALTDLANGRIRSQDEWELRLEKSGVSVSLIHLAQAVFSFIPMFAMFLGSNLIPIRKNLEAISNAKFRPTLNNPSELVSAYYKGAISYDYLSAELAKIGLSDERIKVLLESSLPLLSPGTIQVAYLRNLITETQHDQNLQYYGYDDQQIKLIKELYLQLPQIPDLIRMSVREVFSPDIAEKFGQFEDYPETFTQYARQAGVSEEWAKRYWAAHWELPSATAGFEMFHRGIINYDELNLLLRSLDYMPFWRDRMINLSYQPLTRVDVRRMFQLGVINRDQVKKSYLDLGYSPENAELMTMFTITYEANSREDGLPNPRHLTQDVIIKAYNRGILDKGQARVELNKLGYSLSDGELLLNIADYERLISYTPDNKIEYRNKTVQAAKDGYYRRLLSREDALQLLTDLGYGLAEANQELHFVDLDYSVKVKESIVLYVKKAYTERTITRTDAINILGANGFNGTEQEVIFNEMDLVREFRSEKPTLAQLVKFVKKGVMNLDQFRDELKGLGYVDRYIDMYVASEFGA